MNTRKIANDYLREHIRRHRQEQGLRVEDLAVRSGIPMGSYSNLETGRYRLNPEHILRCQLVLGVPLGEIWPFTIQRCEKVTSEILESLILDARARLPEPLTVERILRAVCADFGLSEADLASPSRNRAASRARTVAAAIVRAEPGLTIVSLSREVNRHYSVLRRCFDWAEDNAEFLKQVRRVQQNLDKPA